MQKNNPRKQSFSSRFNPLKVKNQRLPKSSVTVRPGAKDKGTRFITWLPWPRKNSFHFTWKKFAMWVAGFLAVFIVGIAAVFAYFIRDLPNPKTLNLPPHQSTQILDRNGKQIYSFYSDQNRTLLTTDKISDLSKKATVAVEDSGFYSHSGFSIKGIARAVLCRVTKSCVAGGGSTITQQYIKNTLLTNADTLSRKIKELILAIEVEQVYNKDEILTGYLNDIPYGGSVYGIQAASQTFFGVDADKLTLSQAAILAAIPQRPSYYSPYGSHLDSLFARKNYVLDRMAATGAITQAEADAAKKETPNSETPTFAQRQDLVAPHFVFYVRQQLIDYIGGDPVAAEQQLDQQGYVIKTSLDLDTQNLAESVMQDMGPNTVKHYGASNASLSAVDPKTGEILAMVGSINYASSTSGNTNYANALLQPGSSFKPFVYATEFDKDHKKSPASITYDLQTDFGNYTPQDYDGQFRGPITNRNALDESLNIPAVKNLEMAGISQSIDTAKRLGISSLNGKPSDYGLSLVLGAGEVRPVEMANAYGGFANGGMHNDLRPILTISKDGKVIKDYTTTPAVQAIDPEVAFQIANVLSDNSARAPIFGSKNYLTLPDRPVGAKSGTTQNNRDAWTVGFTPQISVAVWVGNNEANKTMIKGADGSIVAAPIWQNFMKQYLKGKPVVNFDQPSDMKQVTVDKLSGKLPTDQSPSDQRITDWFAPWQVPTDFDDVHVQVKIDRTSGKLATDLTPPQDIDLKTYFTVHSEHPEKPNWEAPVQAWASANGGNNPPPTATDDVHTAGNLPTISIITPGSNAVISGGNINLDTNVGGNQPISKVEFFIDNISVGSAMQSPWQISYNADSLASGSHILQATVTNASDLTASAEITFAKGGDTTPPEVAKNISIVKGTAPRSAKITWTNPSDSDLSQVGIYVSTAANQLGSKVQSVSANPGGNGNVEIPNLALGQVFITLRPIDTTGNENPTSVQTSFIVTP